MGNMIDYLDWRGDLPFSASPFNEVDNLILACLSYVDYGGIVPEVGGGEVPIERAAAAYYEMHTQEEIDDLNIIMRSTPGLLKAAAVTRRYAGTCLRSYRNHTAASDEVQFSAVEIVLPEGTRYVSFRGTDDTIVGWKEDFHLSTGIVPAQREAVNYLNEVAVGKAGTPLYVGGHSKGGNLCVYAAACCNQEVQEQVLGVFNNDGPGFDKAFLESEGFLRIYDRINYYVPTYAIVGMLLCHAHTPTVVCSTEKSILAHNAFTWQVVGPKFERAAETDRSSQLFNESLQSWLSELDTEKREVFIEDFFGVLEASGAQTFAGLQESGLRGLSGMLQRLEKLDKQTAIITLRLMKTLFANWGDLARETLYSSLFS